MKSSDRDLPLKLLTRILFEHLGYFCDIGVQITSKSYQGNYSREQLSDFDVLGIRFDRDLFFERIAAECKSGETKALEELLKLSGIMNTFGISRGYFVKTRIHQNAREVASSLNIATMDQVEIREFLISAFAVNADDALKLEERRQTEHERLLASNQQKFKVPHNYLHYEFWPLEPHRNLQNLIRIGKTIRASLSSTTEDRYLFYRLITMLSIVILQIARKVLATGLNQASRSVSVILFGGPRERRDREVLFDHVNRVLSQQGKNNAKFEPEYLPDLSELVIRVIRSSPLSSQIPTFLDLYKGSWFFGLQVPSGNEITRKLTQDICLFYLKHTGISPSTAEKLLGL